MEFSDKLRERAEKWEEKTCAEKYDNGDVMPEILAYNKKWREENPEKYPYNSAIADFVKEREEISEDLLDYLNTEVYLSQQEIRKEKEREIEQKMKENGFEVLTEERAKELGTGTRIETKSKAEGVLGVINTSGDYKLFIRQDGTPMLMKPKSRTRGYYLSQFDKVFFRVK